MKIVETEASCLSFFQGLVEKYFPEVVELKGLLGNSQAQYFYVKYGLPDWSLSATLAILFGETNNKLKADRSNLKLLLGPPGPFQSGKFGDVTLAVYDRSYLEGVVRIAEEYERETGKAVVVEKVF